MRIGVSFVVVGMFGLGLWAVEQAPPEPKQRQQPQVKADEPAIITVDVTRVNLLFTVTGRRGRFVTDLTKGDFEVIESKKPQNLLEFNAETDLPLRFGILRSEEHTSEHQSLRHL